MTHERITLGIVGVGKIVRDQHLPSIANTGLFELVATASRNASLEGVTSYTSIDAMLDNEQAMQSVALCMPPQYRFEAAFKALDKGKHVLLEKPPGATVSEVELLKDLARKRGVSLFATWHSRHGAAVEMALRALTQRTITSVSMQWCEDVRKWHPGQEWIWQAGGLGVFDPGINGLSILTYLLSESVFVTRASLDFPENKAAPIAASIDFTTPSGLLITSRFDWRQSGNETWRIDFATNNGPVTVADGGGALFIDGDPIDLDAPSAFQEYESIYQRFAEIIAKRTCDVDLRPLKLVADAFLLGERHCVAAFDD